MNYKFIIFLTASISLISGCANFGNGEYAEEKFSKVYNDGLFENIQKTHPSPQVQNYIFNGKLNEGAFYVDMIRNYEKITKLSSASCEASIKIYKAYEKDFFQSENAKKWKNDPTCAVSRELKKQQNRYQDEHVQNLKNMGQRYDKLSKEMYMFINK